MSVFNLDLMISQTQTIVSLLCICYFKYFLSALPCLLKLNIRNHIIYLLRNATLGFVENLNCIFDFIIFKLHTKIGPCLATNFENYISLQFSFKLMMALEASSLIIAHNFAKEYSSYSKFYFEHALYKLFCVIEQKNKN